MTAKYWESESPGTITTAKNVLQYYPQAGKLAVSRPSWVDNNGADRQGKTVALDVAALIEADKGTLTVAREVFAAILARIDERLEVLK